MAIRATYFDGQTARDNDVDLDIAGDHLVFQGNATPVRRWLIADLHSIDSPDPGQPFRITNDKHPGERLVIKDQNFVEDLLQRAPGLRGGYSVRHLGQVFGWTLAGLAGLAAAGYVLLSIAPSLLSPYMPDSWRTRTGKQIEASVTDGVKTCSAASGKSAVGKMIASLSEGNDLPPLTVTVYDLALVNAFAVSGGRIIMTRGLIEEADGPDEIAGVLAHEIGHVANYHPEEQLLRITGLQVLTSVFGGSNSSEIVTSAAALATLLTYSRDAEEEADKYSTATMANAHINPLAFKAFFEKMIKQQSDRNVKSESSNPLLTTLGTVFSTHPALEERVKKIVGLPDGVKATPSLSPQDWQALKAICKG